MKRLCEALWLRQVTPQRNKDLGVSPPNADQGKPLGSQYKHPPTNLPILGGSLAGRRSPNNMFGETAKRMDYPTHVSTPYPPVPFRVRSGTVDIPQATTSYQVLHSLSLILLQNPVDFAHMNLKTIQF